MASVRRSAVALLGATALVGSALVASPASAATPASAAILKTPSSVQANTAAADVTVTYKCRNDATAIYYIRALLRPENGGGYYGRGDNDSPVFERLTATCTGKKVTETIALYSYGNGALPKGRASFEFNLYSLAPPPGSYYGQPGTGPGVSSTSTVQVKTSR